MFMRYLGHGIGHLIHRNSGWQGTNDSNVNDLPSDDNDAEAPDHGAEKVIDDPVESGIAPPDAGMPSDADGDDEPMDLDPPEDDDSDGEDSGDDNEGEEGSEGEEGEGWDSEEGASDDEDDLFDDEGFLDI
ncbi:hypothetical protein B0H13DRAFT_1852427 [Mycena leptocephala]|nr:hypothetical protein B0H13DRAFT_1852427 [Mycena leptocephala]